MNRRELINLLGGAAAAWPIAARAQQKERVRLVGILETQAANSPDGQARYAAFVQGVCTENSIRFDSLTDSASVGVDDCAGTPDLGCCDVADPVE